MSLLRAPLFSPSLPLSPPSLPLFLFPPLLSISVSLPLSISPSLPFFLSPSFLSSSLPLPLCPPPFPQSLHPVSRSICVEAILPRQVDCEGTEGFILDYKEGLSEMFSKLPFPQWFVIETPILDNSKCSLKNKQSFATKNPNHMAGEGWGYGSGDNQPCWVVEREGQL